MGSPPDDNIPLKIGAVDAAAIVIQPLKQFRSRVSEAVVSACTDADDFRPDSSQQFFTGCIFGTVVTCNQHIDIQVGDLAQQHPLAEAVTVTGDQYITFFGIKQDAQAVFIVIPGNRRRKNTDFRISGGKQQIFRSIENLFCPECMLRMYRR